MSDGLRDRSAELRERRSGTSPRRAPLNWLAIFVAAVAAVGGMTGSGGLTEAAPAARSGPSAFLVFTSDRDGDADVYAATPDGTRVAALTRNKAPESGVVLSPTGGSLALWRAFSSTILLSSDGRSERQVGPGEPSSFSPDGSLLSWARERDLGDPYHAVLTPVGGGQSRVLGLGAPGQFSRDGRLLEFSGEDEFGFFDLASGRRRVLLGEDDLESLDYIAWSPSWDRLALLTHGADEPPYDQELLVYDVVAGQKRSLARGDFFGMRWVGAEQIAFGRTISRYEGRVQQIGLVGAADSVEQILAEGDIGTAYWSPRGTYVAYLQDQGSATSLAIEDVETRLVQTIEPDASSVEDMAWSPSGDRLAVSTRRQDGADVTLFDPSGAVAPVRLAGQYPRVYYLSWSPDEATLAFNGGGRIFVASVDGTDSRRVMDAGSSRIVGWMNGTLPAEAPAAGPSPRPETENGSELRSRGRVLEIAADGSWSAALLENSRIDCDHVIAWKPGARPVRFGVSAPCEFGSRRDWLYGLSVAGTKLGWSSFYCGMSCYSDRASADALKPDTYESFENEYDLQQRPPRPLPPRETRRGVRMSLRAGTIRLSRSGHVIRKIRPPGNLADAELEVAGLFYAFNLKRGTFPGRVRFIPFDRLLRG